MGGRCVKGLWRKGGAWGFELRIFTGPGANPNPPFFLTFSRVCTPESLKGAVIVLLWDESGARNSSSKRRCGSGGRVARRVSRWGPCRRVILLCSRCHVVVAACLPRIPGLCCFDEVHSDVVAPLNLGWTAVAVRAGTGLEWGSCARY